MLGAQVLSPVDSGRLLRRKSMAHVAEPETDHHQPADGKRSVARAEGNIEGDGLGAGGEVKDETGHEEREDDDDEETTHGVFLFLV